MPTPDGGIAHAEFMVGDTNVYILDEAPDWHAYAIPEGGMASCLFSIISDDCDKSYEQAVKAGAESLSPPQDHFFTNWDGTSVQLKAKIVKAYLDKIIDGRRSYFNALRESW